MQESIFFASNVTIWCIKNMKVLYQGIRFCVQEIFWFNCGTEVAEEVTLDSDVME